MTLSKYRMRTSYVLVVFLFYLHLNSNAIEWAPINATWYYNLPGYFSMSDELKYLKLYAEKDTVIEGKQCRAIKMYLNGGIDIGTEYLHQSSDSVFYYNYYSQTFHLLYNFSAKKGDTIIVHSNKFKGTKAFSPYYYTGDSIDNFTYRVVEVDSVVIGGVKHKRQKVEPLAQGDWFFYFGNGSVSPTYIIEGIGSLQYFFGLSSSITPETIPPMLRCYNSISTDYKNETWDLPCDYTTPTSLHDNYMKNECSIRNMHFGNLYQVECKDEIIEIRVVDSNGKLCLVKKCTSRFQEFQLNGYEAGLYVVAVYTKTNRYNFKTLKSVR